MEIVLYNNHYEFHFHARLKLEQLAVFLNWLPLGFQFELNQNGFYVDYQRKPGVFVLRHKSEPAEETPLTSELANYYIRWQARASDGDIPRLAAALAGHLSRELETQVWLVDGYGRILRSEGSQGEEQLSA